MGQYKFVDTGPADVDPNSQSITEGIIFGSFDSGKQGWWLVDRQAPSPSEKTITESVPYTQGIFDLSMLGNDRFFNNRDVTFQLKSVGHQYEERKYIENNLKGQLMPLGIQSIFDTHEKGFHWIGKCKSVTVSDSAKNLDLTATVVFDCFPFAIGNEPEGNDVWDDVYFPKWICQTVEYSVAGRKDIALFNIGDTSVEVKIIVTGEVSISGAFGELSLRSGVYTDTDLILECGENEFNVSGNGKIEFVFYKEVMV
ncbi:hypothetical protein WOSG25_061310 [Weissella oryzae SG25]|uniref:Phage tail protein n=1 Tax=Weissella oryzae (strain DSM 25784 / JCM 18191 / LMG 30913 / SG25) TaxID=1329250 RepID=A0A069D0X6_WEIOS|nr:hypothetical protein [Weissella oryzae]GAK31001.1 hypothetical protein WOSG25_061310 [Weissella oryzae SG25]